MSSTYENTRLERIKENRQRMQRLGLFDLSSKLASPASSPASTRGRKRRNPMLASSNSTSQPQPPLGPARRSSRLQNVTPVTYSEAVHVKKERIFKDKVVKLEVGSRPEVYTEEHEKLLGNTERSWTLFVDGCGSDGRRIYDPIKGKTCHQCRQKTLGYRTHCSNCQLVQGQFCGDCLYMRYGEHVLEALETENWLCPPCRGICNCSLCRQAKGWPPTGQLYKKISYLGYKSVAHFLIRTRRSQDDATIHPSSVKRSLPFSNTEPSSRQPREIKDEEQMSASGDVAIHDQTNRSLLFTSEKGDVTDLHQEPSPIPSIQTSPENLGISEVNHGLNGQLGNDFEHTGEEVSDAEGSAQVLGMKPAFVVEPSSNSIASRLRQRHRENAGNNEEAKNQIAMVEHTDKEATNDAEGSAQVLGMKPAFVVEPSSNSIASRLRQRHRENDGNNEEAKNQIAMVEHTDKEATNDAEGSAQILGMKPVSVVKPSPDKHTDKEATNDAEGSAQILGMKPVSVVKPSPDSMASRLRQRRRTNDGNNEEAKNQPAMQVKHPDDEVNDAEGSAQILRTKLASVVEPSPDSISSRLRQRHRTSDGNSEEVKNQTATQVKDENHAANINIALKKTPILKRKPNCPHEPNLDSISARLRQRRQIVKCDGV